jgi:hypothetical protein
MVPDPLITANEVLVSVTVFTTGFLSVRIHGERLRLLEQRDAVRDRLLDATSSGQPVLHIAPPSESEFDLAKVGNSLLFVNLGILLMLLILQFIAGRIAGWVWKWPADEEFWFFAAVDVVETALVIISFVDWRAVRNDLWRDQQQRPWTRLDTARNRVGDAIGKALDEPKRVKQLNEALADLMTLTAMDQTWLEPLELRVLVDWLRGGAQGEETDYVVAILGRIAESLQAEAYELLGDSPEAARRRKIALAPGQNFQPLLVSSDETFTPPGMLQGGWLFLEIYNNRVLPVAG